MIFKPKQYQSFCIQKIIDQPEVGLFLDMGMGKTAITLTAAEDLVYNRFEVSRVLIIAPLRPALETWPHEIRKWDHLKHLRFSMVTGSRADRTKALNTDVEFYITNREQVTWLVEIYGKSWPFDMVIIDELSSFKSSKAQRFRALKRVRPYIKRIVGLTGTPTPNGLIDLWPQMYLLDQGKALGRTITGYRTAFFEPDKRNATTIFSWRLRGEKEEEQIYDRIKDTCISMKSSDFLDLPKVVEVTQDVLIPPKAYARYRTLEKEMFLELPDGEIDAGSAGILAGKLLQLSGGAVYGDMGRVKVIHEAKLEALDSLIDEANGQSVLVFYQYKHELERILSRYREARVITEPGAVEDWNKGNIPILAAHPASAGHGLNLQAGGHIIIWYSVPFSLELYLQANKRLHRIGQTKTVSIHKLVAVGTIDEKIVNYILTNKKQRQDALIDAVKARMKEVV